ncbi:MAG: O-antigen ligase family protein [Acidimicrobiia bacterium]
MTPTDVALTHREHVPRTLATLRVATVAALIVVIPWNVHYGFFIKEHSPHLVGSHVQQTILGPVDVGFLILIVASIRLLTARSTYTKQPAGQLGAAIAVVVVAIWLVMFPTAEGAVMLFRVIGVFVTIVAIRHFAAVDIVPGIVWPLAIGASFQALIALTQTLVNDSGMVVPATTMAVGRAWTAGRGTFSGPYSLAAYLILAIVVLLSFGIASRPFSSRFRSISLSRPTRIAMWTTVGLASAAVATTFGRTVLLSLAVVGATYSIGWLLKRQRILGVSALAVIAPFVGTALVVRSGWLVRASQTAAGDLTTRDTLIARAIDMIQSSPLIGIGPVQYGPNLAQMGLPVPDAHVVHNLPLLIAVEFGIVVGIAFLVWIVALGVRSIRQSTYLAALFLFTVPFFLLDNLHYVYGNGMAALAIWIAFLDYHSKARNTSHDSGDVLAPPLPTPETSSDPER